MLAGNHMKHTMWKLHNVIKHYDWGSKTALTQLFNIENTDHLPQAELWMGAHPAGTSIAVTQDGQSIKLNELIAQNPRLILGEKTAKTYHGLPYLFKILAADSALSIQVHPELSKAKRGFNNENELGIALDSPMRNYKDPNHKPELIYALTPFWAMNGFRPVKQIIELFQQLNIECLEKGLTAFTNTPTEAGLKTFFYFLLTLNDDIKQQAISELKNRLIELDGAPFNIIKHLIKQYPNDCGLFSPLILNVIELKPGQAMFLTAQTPHAYLKGSGLEIMANSDNVLRAGLTHKHIDINELLNNTEFKSISPNALLTTPIHHKNKIDFPVPVKDFAFEILHSNTPPTMQLIHSAEIILCIEGEVTLSTKTDLFKIKTGESVFIAHSAQSFHYYGHGTLARAFNAQ